MVPDSIVRTDLPHNDCTQESNCVIGQAKPIVEVQHTFSQVQWVSSGLNYWEYLYRPDTRCKGWALRYCNSATYKRWMNQTVRSHVNLRRVKSATVQTKTQGAQVGPHGTATVQLTNFGWPKTVASLAIGANEYLILQLLISRVSLKSVYKKMLAEI